MSSDEPESPSRRDVVSLAVGGSAVAFAAAVVVPVARFVEPRPRPTAGPTPVGRLDEFPLGSARTVLVDDRPVLVLRGQDGQLQAFSALCTHLQCVVGWSAERNQIECPCHRGAYSRDGKNLAGPPPRPLDTLGIVVSDGLVIVSKA
jgi:Rieske Fe-S protein